MSGARRPLKLSIRSPLHTPSLPKAPIEVGSRLTFGLTMFLVLQVLGSFLAGEESPSLQGLQL